MTKVNKIATMPWVEKYRPTSFGDIVLNDINKEVCNNIINLAYFPNLLLYGPPGTGKTTTIINLVTSFQKRMGTEDKSLMIHLNASDDRGIDIIRNQILQFVNSKCLFKDGLKIVILDEVDYMTKNAQQALRYLITTYSSNVRFCLICNYITRIDDGLQTEFLKIRFNNLPQKDISKFLTNIVGKENISLAPEKLNAIQKLYGSDIRSMINFIQCNHILHDDTIHIISDEIWNELTHILKSKSSKKSSKQKNIINHINLISLRYNITIRNIVKDYLTYLIKYQKIDVTSEFLDFVEKLLHNTESPETNFLNYALVNLDKFATLL
jgi:DNA polymerase III delta prime subunit